MKKVSKVQKKRKFLLAALTLALMASIWLFSDRFAMVSHAQSQGRVTATSANIRKEPSSTSQVIGSTVKDKIITITNQVEGSDGYTWYQTFVDAETLGYIRSDLVTIIEGGTPATVTPVAPSNPTPTSTGNNNETPAEVTRVNPVSATVTGGSSVRVRSNASTTSTIVKKVSSGLALTVTGTAPGTDGKTWYKVSFSEDGSEIEGFIRSDYVKLSEDLTPYTEPEEPPVSPEPEQPEQPVVPEVVKDFDTDLQDGVWYLLDRQKNQKHDIQDLYEKVEKNAAAYIEADKKVKTQKAVIIVLVFLLIAASAAVAILVFKIRDMADAAYINEVEKETMKRRGTARSQGGSQKVMHTVGTGSQAGRPGQRPTGAKPAGTTQGSSQGQRPAGATQGSGQGQRPAGTRPAGASQGSSQGQRPVGMSQASSQGQRPAGMNQASSQGQRPVGTSQGSSQGQRPAGMSQASSQGQRPAGASQGSGQGQRPVGMSQGSGQSQRPAGTSQGSSQGQKPPINQQGRQSRNFMAEEDDEFEFEFLNYDGDEE